MNGRYRAALVVVLGLACGPALAQEGAPEAERLRRELAACTFRVICESYRDGNWELMLMNADGSGMENVTRTPEVDELYPHASPDGTKLVFLQDEGEGEQRRRDVYVMNIDGSGRVRVAENGRQPFWSPDGKTIAYAGGTDARYPKDPYVNQGLWFYDVATQEVTAHPRDDISGLLNACFSPDGRWVIASAVRGMGFNKSIIAFQAHGAGVAELIRSRAGPDDLYQCRPDVSPDGLRVAWGTGNTRHRDYMWVEVAEVDFNVAEPKIGAREKVVQVDFPVQTYHVDWSPDGKYIVYSQGTIGGRMQQAQPVIGNKAEGWDLWVVNPAKPNVCVRITQDGLSYKEPDWVFVNGNEG